jgi:hypothetical protein
MTVLEQSYHDLVAEVARGFGQIQQKITQLEMRIDAIDTGVANI